MVAAKRTKGSQVKPRHLVDGVPMILYQRRDGNGKGMAWYGRWHEGKRQKTRYFGVEDPRGRYPLFEIEMMEENTE